MCVWGVSLVNVSYDLCCVDSFQACTSCNTSIYCILRLSDLWSYLSYLIYLSIFLSYDIFYLIYTYLSYLTWEDLSYLYLIGLEGVTTVTIAIWWCTQNHKLSIITNQACSQHNRQHMPARYAPARYVRRHARALRAHRFQSADAHPLKKTTIPERLGRKSAPSRICITLSSAGH